MRTLSLSVWGGLQPKGPDQHDRVHNDICQTETQKLERQDAMCKLVPHVHTPRILVEHLHVEPECLRNLREPLVGQYLAQGNLLRAAVTIWLRYDSP